MINHSHLYSRKACNQEIIKPHSFYARHAAFLHVTDCFQNKLP